MDKESLFQSIKREEVILWVGAGFSKYAGYPMGGEFASILYNTLVTSEKKQVNEKAPLMDLAEDYITLKRGKRSQLTSELQKAFRKDPKSTKYHDMLAKLPHFKHIITTNYDTLFERAYGERSHVIIKGNTIPLGGKDLTNIYKIHGDINQPETIILASGDYRKFFNYQDDNPVWNFVKSLVSNHVVLFLGYGYEDPNIVAMFEKIQDQLGEFMKEAYLVAPGYSELKQRKLKDIVYIDSTGEDFVQELSDNIRQSLFTDVSENTTRIDTAGKYLNGLGLIGTFRREEGKSRIDRIDGNGRDINYSFQFNLDNDHKKTIAKRINEITSGKTIGKVELNYSEFSDFILELEGMRLPFDETGKFIIASAPLKEGKFDVIFEDCDCEYNGLEGTIFKSNEVLQFVVKYKSATFTITTDKNLLKSTKYVIESKNEDTFPNVKEGLEVGEFFKHLGTGGNIKLIFQDRSTFHTTSGRSEGLIEQAEWIIDYMNKFKLIEKTFKLRFSNFKLNDSREDIELLGDILRSEGIISMWDGDLKVPNIEKNNGMLEIIKNGVAEEYSLFSASQMDETFDILGNEIPVKYTEAMYVVEPIVKLSDDEKEFIITSKTGKEQKKYFYPAINLN